MNRKIYSKDSAPSRPSRMANDTITIEDPPVLTRKLHKDSDLLPSMTSFMSSNVYSKQSSNDFKITKRHVAVVSTRHDDFQVIDRYSSDYMTTASSIPRKVASGPQSVELRDNNPKLKRVKKMESNDRFETMSKYSWKSAPSGSNVSLSGQPQGIISTSSWRVGEALAKEQLGDQIDGMKSTKSGRRVKLNDEKPVSKGVKRTECHLVEANMSRPKTATSKENVSKPGSSKSRPYDPKDIQKFMQLQKLKRQKELKMEQEKDKIEMAERRKKRQEAQKQRALNDPIPKPTRVDKPKQEIMPMETYESDQDDDMSSYFRRKIASLLDEETVVKKTAKKVEFDREESYSQEIVSSIEENTFEDEMESVRPSNKHDRLRKICSVAWDLQAKIEQTKLALERIGVETDSLPRDEELRHRSVSSPPATSPPRPNIDMYMDSDDLDLASLPGVKIFRPDGIEMSRDLAARRIQSAYRIYTSRRGPFRREIVRHSWSQWNPPNPKTAADPPKFLPTKVDEYNFINVYMRKNQNNLGVGIEKLPKKKSPTRKTASVISDSKQKYSENQANNYTEDFATFNPNTRTTSVSTSSRHHRSAVSEKSEDEEKSSISTNMEQASSSSSTSLSKYVNSKSMSVVKSDPRASTATLTERGQDTDVETDRSTSGSGSEGKRAEDATTSSSASMSVETRRRKVAVARTLRVMAEPTTNRYSPASLERLLHINMNYLDTLNVSAVQLEELDKVRCVGRAQQETVALAYLLKSKTDQEGHDKTEIRPRTVSPSTSSTKSSSSESVTKSSSSLKTKTDEESSRTSRKDETSSSIRTETGARDTKDGESTDEVETGSEIKTNDSRTIDGKKSAPRRLSFENDSFKKFTAEMIEKFMKEEAMRSRHQAHLLKLRERALVEKTNAELSWLEQMKRKALDKGQDDRMPSMLAKERGIMSKLRQEQENIDRMKAAQKREAESRLDVLAQHAEVVKWCQDKLRRLREARMASEEPADELEDDDNNQSLIEEKVLKQVKKNLNSEKFLTEREKKLRERRKQAEELIAWKKKLDEEEMRVREIEKRAKSMLSSKKPPESDPVPKLADSHEDNSYIETFVSAPTSSRIPTQINSSKALKSTASNLESESIRTQLEKESTQSIKENLPTTETRSSTTRSSSSSSSSSSLSDVATTASTHSAHDLEIKVRELKNELLKKKSEAEQLKRSLKAKEKIKLKEKENELRKKINSYDALIGKIKNELDREDTSEASQKTPPVVKRASKPPPPPIRHEKFEKPIVPKNRSNNDDDIKTDTINDQVDDKSSVTSSSLQQSSQIKVFKADKEAKQPDTVKPPKPQSPTPYDDDFVSSEKRTSLSRASTSSRTSSSSSSDRPKEDQPPVRSQIVEEDEKSTVSEISEEILGESSAATEPRKSLKLNLGGRNEDGADDEPTSTSSSSTDTQILLLSSRNKKTEEEETPIVEPPPPKPKDIRETVADKLEKSMIDEAIEDAVEIHERKMSRLLADQYKEAIAFNLDEDEQDSDEDVNNIDNTSPFKIHVPSIDLSMNDEDEDDLVRTGSRKPTPKPPVIYNVPVSKEIIAKLTDSLVDKYWPKLSDLKSILDQDEIDIDGFGLTDFFKSNLEIQTPEALDAEATFKRMLVDLVGELMYDLYLERFETPRIVSPYLPAIKRGPKKTYFKSIHKGPSDLDSAKKQIANKTVDLLLKVDLENKKSKRHEIASSRTKWRLQKRLDLVDSLLDLEMREQDYEWANYEVEEHESKILVANTIFDMVLKDTIDCFQVSFMKKHS